MKKLEAIAIIPARKGSKRILDKNIKMFCGQPIIKYSIDAALASGCFEDVIVSTDSPKIANLSKEFGASVPFMRSKKNSSDIAPIADAIIEVIEKLRKKGIVFRYFCCIYATVPTISVKRIVDAFKLIKEKDADSVIPITEFDFPIERALDIKEGYIKMIWPENEMKRSQDFPKYYHDAARFVWVKRESFLKQKRFYMKKSIPLILRRSIVQDIDTQEDWKIAEIKFKALHE